MDYLNLDNTVGNNERANVYQSRCSQCGGLYPNAKFFKQYPKEKGYKKLPFNPRNSNNKSNEQNGWKPNTCFRCGLEDNFITSFPKLDTLDKKVQCNTENPKTCAYTPKKIDKMSEK